MYANLNAERVRKGMSNEDVARVLDMSRQAFERKMRNGRFLVDECRILCNLFGCAFDYLFAVEEQAS